MFLKILRVRTFLVPDSEQPTPLLFTNTDSSFRKPFQKTQRNEPDNAPDALPPEQARSQVQCHTLTRSRELTWLVGKSLRECTQAGVNRRPGTHVC